MNQNNKLKWRVLLVAITVSIFAVTIGASVSRSSAPFRVTKATLRGIPTEYLGPCPAAVEFRAKISATGGKGTVVFQIVRSDGSPGPAVTMAFTKSGTNDTTYSWHANETFLGWHQLKITSPNVLESNKVEIAIQCE